MGLAFRGHRQLVILTRAVGLGTVAPAAFRALVALAIDPQVAVSYGEWPWTVKLWAEELLILFYYLALLRFAKRRLAAALPGAEPGRGWLIEKVVSQVA
jgi:hypothetical protein